MTDAVRASWRSGRNVKTVKYTDVTLVLKTSAHPAGSSFTQSWSRIFAAEEEDSGEISALGPEIPALQTRRLRRPSLDEIWDERRARSGLDVTSQGPMLLVVVGWLVRGVFGDVCGGLTERWNPVRRVASGLRLRFRGLPSGGR